MLNKNISIVKYKEMLEKQLEEENKQYLKKLNYILNDVRTYSTSRIVNICSLLYDYENLTEDEIKIYIDILYNSLNKRTKRRE